MNHTRRIRKKLAKRTSITITKKHLSNTEPLCKTKLTEKQKTKLTQTLGNLPQT